MKDYKKKTNKYKTSDSSDYLYDSIGSRGNFGNLAGMLTSGNPMRFMETMFQSIEQHKRENRNKQAGIQELNGLYGVPEKNIEFKFDMLDFNGKFFQGRADGLDHVFDKDGKFLFSAEKYEYLGRDIFLVFTDKEPKKGQSSCYGYMFKNGEKLTDSLFRSQRFSNFDKGNFCVLGYKDFSGECVVNTNGEVVLQNNKGLVYIYLHDNVASVGGTYYNLFTGEKICEKSYSSSLDIKGLMFVKCDEQVYKINTFTGEYEIFGEPKQAPQIKDIPIVNGCSTTVGEVVPDLLKSAKKQEPKLKKQGRNELCRCGSGKKVKHCDCGGK